ncbi:acyl carrier protein [Maritimibacter sp. UBA3975]|uniref:acyl carrier protein n=1 Tax=Maritimibacter sp. UBA3975 TaxID=1946833 RepID=UPI000C091760|nr:acyl carrier protein [Maritimibacter sp. UBA3975]MAM60241.1 phosphopantetheine-binding protein [Maritimibacter sp.]|tara:strand:- start:11937 stop:12212 length:276 start_codon:yes stop_codon:yes gene_type:complete
MTDRTDDIERTVIAILARQAVRDAADLVPEDQLEALGIDSMGLVETIFAVEETFDVSVPFNANAPEAGGMDLTTVGSVVEAVRGLVSSKAA